MKLFKLTFSEDTRTCDLDFRGFDDEFFFLSDGNRWISGGIYLCAPREFTNDFRIVILIQILDKSLVINTYPTEFFFYLQYVAGYWLKHGTNPEYEN